MLAFVLLLGGIIQLPLAMAQLAVSARQSDSLHLARQRHQVDSLRLIVKGFPVVPFRDTLFYIYTRQGSFSAAERAEAVARRIRRLGDEYQYSADSLLTSAAEQTIDIEYKNNLIVSVSGQDALWAETSAPEQAERLRALINSAIVKYQQETGLETRVKQALMACLLISGVALLIYLVGRLIKWLTAKVISGQGSWKSKGIKISNTELLNAEQKVNLIEGIAAMVKWLIVALLVYMALPLLFSIFPATAEMSGRLLGYFLNPVKKVGSAVWDYLPNLFTIIVLVLIFRFVLKVLNYFKSEIACGRIVINGFYPDWANPTYQILRIMVLAFMLIVIFPYMPGSDSQVFKGVSVFMGLVFTLGSAGALGNVVAGLVLTYMRAFKIGDRVKINEVTGDIISKSLLVTRIRTIQNEIISIPNSSVMNTHTINYSAEAAQNGLILHTSVTIGYDSPWRQVHALLIEAALATHFIDAEPKPYVLQTSLDDYYVSYRLNAYTKHPNRQAVIYSELHQNIQDAFNRAGVEIMSPHYRAQRDGNASTVIPDAPPAGTAPQGS